jgi:hypothetical protein
VVCSRLASGSAGGETDEDWIEGLVLAAGSTSGDVLWWCLILMGGICVLGAAVWLVRRWSLGTPASQAREPWSLQDLRDLKADGRISDEEFQILRERLILATRGGPAKTAETEPPPQA